MRWLQACLRHLDAALLLFALGASSLVHADAAPPAWLSESLGGLTATVSSATENAFAQPSAALSNQELRVFALGNRIFNTNWVAAPASVSAFDGLGPVYNRVSCSGCHTRDGRGQPPREADDPLDAMVVRLSIPGAGAHGAPRAVPHYGDQLNEKALPNVPPEGRTQIRYTEREGRYPDGTRFTLAAPEYTFTELAFGALPVDVQSSPRVAPPVFGLGLLEAVAERTVLAAADPDDADHDGVSGRPNYVWDWAAAKRALGRFGWKANQPSVRQQNAAAALGDIGLTTRLFPVENVAEGQLAAAQAQSGGVPELDDRFLDSVTSYVQTLAVPAARGVADPIVQQGAHLFEAARCSACHLPTLKTGDQPQLPFLSFQVIHPFTDLLLHDMGEQLKDGRPDFEATGREWRTAPLWGIGLTATVSRHTRFLHDGRARSIEEAILWHGGEAEGARQRFMALSKPERDAVLAFLQGL